MPKLVITLKRIVGQSRRLDRTTVERAGRLPSQLSKDPDTFGFLVESHGRAARLQRLPQTPNRAAGAPDPAVGAHWVFYRSIEVSFERCWYNARDMTVLRKLSCGILSLALVACMIPLLPAAETEVVKLWPGDAPGSEAVTEEESVRTTEGGDHVVSKVHQPSLTVYLPTENATGAAVVIAPGGGHRELWMDHEGYNVADWLRRHGVAAFVLKYRLGRV